MTEVLEINKKEELKKAAEKLGVDLVLLFGSRADGSNRKDSDFDIAYHSQKPIESFSDIFRPIMEYIGSDNLHITDMRNIQPLFLYEIMKNCKVLYSRNIMNFYNLRCYAFKRYHDEVKPLFKLKLDKLKEEYLV